MAELPLLQLPTAEESERLGEMGLVYRSPDGKTFQIPSDRELAARLVLLKILDRLLGPSDKRTPLEFAKASIIRDEIGDNRNASAFVRTFRLWKAESAERLVLSGRAEETMQRRIRSNAAMLSPLSNRRPQLNEATLAEWLCGDIQQAKRAQAAFLQAFLDEIDQSQIVEQSARPDDLKDGGDEHIKGAICQFMQGGRERVGFTPKPLTDSQLAVAQKIYENICKSGDGELYGGGMAAALFHAINAWYGKAYEDAVLIATHVLDDIDPSAGEAFRVRAFALISLGRLEEARNDLQAGLASTPTLGGAKEPLALLERKISSATS